MARNWTKLFEWKNAGSEPSSTLKNNGFAGGYKPPASIFNRFFNLTKACFDQIQAVIDEDEADIATLESDMQTAKSDISTAKSDISTANSAILTVKSDMKTAKSDIQTVQSRVQPLNLGGTGATSAEAARTNLNVPSVSEVELVNTFTIGAESYNYINWVLPLIPLNLNDSATVYFTGSIFMKRQNTLRDRMTRVYVTCGKAFDTAIPTYSMSLDNIDTGEVRVEPRTFTYNGVKYFGLYVITTTAGYDGTKFIIGKASHRSIISPIMVYNNNTKEVLNEEIYNSLANEGNINEKIFYGTPIVKADDKTRTVALNDMSNVAVFKPIAVSSTDGKAYTATVDGITELYNGMTITIIPNKQSTTKDPTLNINNLGAYPIILPDMHEPKRYNGTNRATYENWLYDGIPMKLIFDSSANKWKSDKIVFCLYDMIGTLAIEQGGTAATEGTTDEQIEQARINLKNAGKSVKDKAFKYTDRQDTTEVTAGEGAEIFNDYRDRSYSNTLNKESYSGNAATGAYATAMGSGNAAGGNCSFVIGQDNFSKGLCSFAGGTDNRANDYQTVIGKYAAGDTGASVSSNEEGSLFVIGNGLYTITTNGYGAATGKTTRTNAFRVSAKGGVYGSGSYNTTGADYAEYCEWLDGNPDNEDRRGLFVTLDGEKIKLANSNEPIWGVISSNPSVVGDAQSECWKDMYLKDVFGDYITEKVTVPEYTDEVTGEVVPEHEETRWVLNPDYDPDKEYISREFRAEWAAVGMFGKIVVVDDGTCQVNGYCTASEGGIATASETGFRVLSRIDESHIKIFVTPNFHGFYE